MLPSSFREENGEGIEGEVEESKVQRTVVKNRWRTELGILFIEAACSGGSDVQRKCKLM
jgi:hypothetical protein